MRRTRFGGAIPSMRWLVAIIFALGIVSACSEVPVSDSVYTSWLDDEALAGYDVVSFYSGKPLKGNDLYRTRYMEAEWSFSSRANLDLFLTNPDVFVPQYGGHCAWAMAHGKLAKGSPEQWHVRDGRLYLNFNARIKTLWDADIPDYIRDADRFWPNLSQKK